MIDEKTRKQTSVQRTLLFNEIEDLLSNVQTSSKTVSSPHMSRRQEKDRQCSSKMLFNNSLFYRKLYKTYSQSLKKLTKHVNNRYACSFLLLTGGRWGVGVGVGSVGG